jgi:hypothetical protein
VIFFASTLLVGASQEHHYYSDSGEFGVTIEIQAGSNDQPGFAAFQFFSLNAAGERMLIGYGDLDRLDQPAWVAVADEGHHWVIGYDRATHDDETLVASYTETTQNDRITVADATLNNQSPELPWQGGVLMLPTAESAFWLRLRPGAGMDPGNLVTQIEIPWGSEAAIGGSFHANDESLLVESVRRKGRVDSSNQHAYYLYALGMVATSSAYSLLTERIALSHQGLNAAVMEAIVEGVRSRSELSDAREKLITLLLSVDQRVVSKNDALWLIIEAGRWRRNGSLIQAISLWMTHPDPEIRHQVLVTMSLLDMLNAIELARRAATEDSDPMVRRRAREVVLGSTRLAEGAAVDELLLKSIKVEIREDRTQVWLAHAVGCFLVEYERQHGAGMLDRLRLQHPEMMTHVQLFQREFDTENTKVYPPNRVTRMLHRIHDEIHRLSRVIGEAS